MKINFNKAGGKWMRRCRCLDLRFAHAPIWWLGYAQAELTPTVRRLLGIASGEVDREDYHRYLMEKYGQ